MKVLIVEDEKLLRWSIVKALQKEGFFAFEADSLLKAKEIIIKEEPNIILLDVNLPDGNGYELLDWVLGSYSDMIVIILTAHGKIKEAIEAIKKGCFDYLEKPMDIEELLVYLKKAVEHLKLKKRLEELEFKKNEEEGCFIVKSEKMLEILNLAHAAATSDTKIITILGESGTGKEVIARFIHNHSQRKDFPFLVINCAAVPETLLESELFGHEKGAFTDAKEQKKGLLELADGGTLLLDEIGDLKINLQSKFLRVLESGCFRRVGGIRDIYSNVRFIAATNQDLYKKIEEKLFREDLYYRLMLFPINLPPLRERREEIIPLAECYLEFYNKKFRKKVLGFSKDAIEALLNYDWYGNIRELRNVIERAMILQRGEHINARDLNIPMLKKEEVKPYNFQSLQEMEIEMIKKALNSTKGNVSKAARILKISRDKLRYRIKRYGFGGLVSKEK